MGLKITVQIDTTVPSGGRIRVVNQSVTGPAGANGTNGVGVPVGGTTGQVLAKASNTNYDTQWVTDATGIPATIFDAKGDIIAATAADTAARLAAGTTGQVLTVDPVTSTGLKWATPSSGGIPETLLDAKGDLIVASAADTAARLAVGTNGYRLMADSSATTGLAWMAGADGLVQPLSGTVSVPGHVQTYSYQGGFGHTANQCLFMPIIIGRPITITSALTNVSSTTGAQSNRVSIYSSGTNGLPTTLVSTLGVVDCSTTGVKTISGLSVSLNPGLYWTCVQSSAGVATIRFYNSANPSIILNTMAAANNQVRFIQITQSYGASAPSTITSTPTATTGTGDASGWMHLVMYTWTNN